MDRIFESPLAPWSSALLLALAALSAWRGARLRWRGLSQPDHPSQTEWVLRGLRGGILALGLVAFAAGLFYGIRWPLYFGSVFLGEELFEIGIMLLALRTNPKT